MVDFLINLLINILDFILQFLPSLPADSQLISAFESAADPFFNAFFYLNQIPFLRLLGEFLSFAVPIIFAIYTYKAIAWIYNALRGHAG